MLCEASIKDETSKRSLIQNKEDTQMSNKAVVPQAQEALEKFKYEVANEIGVPLKQGYNGDLTSAQNGYVGGYMVKKMIEKAEQEMSGGRY